MRKMNILSEEDNLDHVFPAKKTFFKIHDNGFKYKLDIVNDGKEAIKNVKNKGEYADDPRPDLILLELKRPGKDGFGVLREIKGESRFCTLPLGVSTSSTDEKDFIKSHSLPEKGMSIPTSWCRVTALPLKNRGGDGGEAREDTLS